MFSCETFGVKLIKACLSWKCNCKQTQIFRFGGTFFFLLWCDARGRNNFALCLRAFRRLCLRNWMQGCVVYMQPRSLCNISGNIDNIGVAAIFDGGLSWSQDAFLFKHSLQKRFFYLLLLSTAVIFNIKIQNCTCVPFRKSQIRERERHSNWRVGEIFLFKGRAKSYGRQKRGGRNFPNNAALPDWLFLPTSERFFFEARKPPPS